MDEFDRLMQDLLVAKDRTISTQRHDIATLLQALAVHEGRDVQTTTLVHLGRTLEAL